MSETRGAPTRANRFLDLIATALVAAGVIAYGYGLVGMNQLAHHGIAHPTGNLQSNEWIIHYRAAYIGLRVAITGIVVAILSFAIHARRR